VVNPLERCSDAETSGVSAALLGFMKDLGLLGLRLFLGGTMAAHGTQKLYGWFGGVGLEASGKVFEQHLRYAPGERYALMAARSEIASGVLIATGALTPFACAGAVSTMIVAAAAHAENGFFATDNGYELPAAYAAMSATLALTGPGKYSLDHLTGAHRLHRPALAALALSGAVLGALGVLSQRLPKEEPRVENQ
jgi:putative oxidoreductase